MKNNIKTKYVYLVGERGMQGESILHVCQSYPTAYLRWNEIRKALIDFFEGLYEATSLKKFGNAIEKLQCKDPDQLHNFPYLEPFINKKQVNED